MAHRIVILGAGFAGLWAAAGAARKLDELGIAAADCEILVVNRDAWHGIRVRNYESDLSDVRVPLDSVFEPIGVRRLEAVVQDIDLQSGHVRCAGSDGEVSIPYDRLVFALGSAVFRPEIPGLADHGFDVDTYDAASRLDAHLRRHAGAPVAVIGAGLTGIEVATELAGRLNAAGGGAKVTLLDHNRIGSDMGAEAFAVIGPALDALGIATRPEVSVVGVDRGGVVLAGGERIKAATLVWCGGMRAHKLAGRLGVPLDGSGRVAVDACMKVEGAERVFAAGDAAVALLDGEHASVMSCQHGRPMGRYAGHNVVCDLFGLPQLKLQIAWYAILDLGAQGAVYTQGWDRHVVASGAIAKATKIEINRRRIYPPRHGTRSEILQAAAPTVQPPPARERQ